MVQTPEYVALVIHRWIKMAEEKSLLDIGGSMIITDLYPEWTEKKDV